MKSPDAGRLAEAQFRKFPGHSMNWWLLPETPRTRYAYWLGARGEPQRAARLAAESLEDAQKALAAGNQSPRVPLEIAAVHLLRSDPARAIDWLQRGYDAGWRNYRTLARDPVFDALHDEPKFQALLERTQSDVATMRQRAMIDQMVPIPPPMRTAVAVERN